MKPTVSRRKFVVGVTASTLLLAACGAPPAPTAAPTSSTAQAPVQTKPTEAAKPTAAAKPAEQGQITLQLANFVVSPEDREAFKQVFKAFEEKHPTIKIQVDEAQDYATKMLTMMAAGTPPDTMMIHPNDLAAFASRGGLRDMDDIIKGDSSLDIKQYNSVVLDYFKFKGHLYSLPYYSGPSMIYYNKTLFEKFGVKLPDDYTDDEWHWDKGFLDACLKLSQGSGASRTYGFGGLAKALSMIAAPVWSNGGDLIDWEGHTKAYLTTPPTLAAFQIQADYVTKHKVVPPPSEAASYGEDWASVNGFMTGRIGVLFGGRFWGPQLRAVKDFKVGMWYQPMGTGGRYHRNGPNGYGVPSKAKHADEGWEFVKFIVGPRGQGILFSVGRNVPLTTRTEDMEAFQKSLAPWEKGDVYLEGNKNMKALAPLPAKWSEMNRVYGTAWDQVLLGQKDVKTALSEVNTQWEDLMKQGG